MLTFHLELEVETELAFSFPHGGSAGKAGVIFGVAADNEEEDYGNREAHSSGSEHEVHQQTRLEIITDLLGLCGLVDIFID